MHIFQFAVYASWLGISDHITAKSFLDLRLLQTLGVLEEKIKNKEVSYPCVVMTPVKFLVYDSILLSSPNTSFISTSESLSKPEASK